MDLQDLILTEEASVKQAVERLEKVRCRVVYVVKGKKLLASVSDGDVRRYTLSGADIEKKISCIANYSPSKVNEYEKEKSKEIFQRTELQSIPLVNLNDEIVGVIFRNGKIIREYKKMNVPVVMMAGGKGTRLHPYTKILPKALIPIGDIPISELIMNRFFECGCKDFYLLVNHKSAMIQSYFDNIDKKYNIRYFQETEPLGTGGGLSLLKDCVHQDFILTNCDILIDADYSSIYDMHCKKGNFITMVLSQYENNMPYGVVSIDKDNNYQGMTEKPSFQHLINTGVYVVNRQVVEDMPEQTQVNFPDMIELYRKQGKKIGCYIVNESAYMDMGQFEELEKMKERLNVL